MAAQSDTRTKEQIEAEIAAARHRLAGNIEGLITQAHPKAVFLRGVADVKDFATQEATAAKAQFVASTGSVRTDRVALVAAAVVGSLAFLAIVRSIVRR